MKLVYSKSCRNQADIVHRFDVLGELLSSDLEVLKNSIRIFFEKLSKTSVNIPVVIIDVSECTLRVNEAKLQIFVESIKAEALASQVLLTIAQSDIESMHAEQQTIEQNLLNKLNLLENKLNLMESIKNKIQTIKKENQALREKLNASRPKNGARSLFEKFWGES